jgi:hypothetical protein
MSIQFKDGLGDQVKFDDGEIVQIKGSYFKVSSLSPHPVKIELQPAPEDVAKEMFSKTNINKPGLSSK